MGTVLHYYVVEVGRLYHFIQPHHVLVHQVSVDVDLGLQHLQVGASEFFQFDHLDGVSLVGPLYLYPLVDLAGVAFAEVIVGGVLVDANFDLMILEGVELFHPLLLGIVAGK